MKKKNDRMQIHNKSDIKPISTRQSSTLSALKLPNFQWFLTGTSLTNAAFWIQRVTINWLVYDLSGSGTLLGTLNLVRAIATVGLAPLAGVAIDRLSRYWLFNITNGWLFSISLGFGLALLDNPTLIWPLFLFSFLGGIGHAFSQPLRQTLVFSIVPRSLAPSAVAVVQTGWALMRSIGSAIGGFLVLLLGPAGNFFIQAAAYALVTYTILKLQIPNEKIGVGKTVRQGGFREGWQYISSNPATRAFLLMSWLLPLLIIPNFNALPPIYAKDIYAGGPDTLGMLLSAIGIGGSIGGFITILLGRIKRWGLLQLGSLFMLSLSILAFAFSTEFWVGLISLVAAGLFEMIYLTTNMTMLQLSIPNELRGRVMGILSLRIGLIPVGAFIAGIGADLIGPRSISIILGAMAGIISMLVYFFSSTVREYCLSNLILESAPEA